MSNRNLQRAKEARNNEFFTRYEDVAAEIGRHRAAFAGKRILCNCDDPARSQIAAYLKNNYTALGLKSLITTGYDAEGRGVYSIYESIPGGIQGGYQTDAMEDGSFDSPEALELLRCADIVVTNPPFSEIRRFVQTLHERDKRFLIVAPLHAMTAKNIFPLFQNFGYVAGLTRPAMMETSDGARKLGNLVWINGLRDGIYPEPLQLSAEYSPERYPYMDNYTAINVDRVQDIPADFHSVMGVPVSFLQYFRPDQWELVGVDESCGHGASNGLYTGGAPDHHVHVNGERKFTRVFIARR